MGTRQRTVRSSGRRFDQQGRRLNQRYNPTHPNARNKVLWLF